MRRPGYLGEGTIISPQAAETITNVIQDMENHRLPAGPEGSSCVIKGECRRCVGCGCEPDRAGFVKNGKCEFDPTASLVTPDDPSAPDGQACPVYTNNGIIGGLGIPGIRKKGKCVFATPPVDQKGCPIIQCKACVKMLGHRTCAPGKILIRDPSYTPPKCPDCSCDPHLVCVTKLISYKKFMLPGAILLGLVAGWLVFSK